LNNDRNIALMPDLIQQQISLGRFVQREMNITDVPRISEIVESVLGRTRSWLDFYRDNIENGALEDDKVARAEAVEGSLVTAAESEARFALATWERDDAAARQALEDSIEETGRADAPLAGWHNVWLGGLYEKAGDFESAGMAYAWARSRLGTNAVLPKLDKDERLDAEPTSPFAASVYRLIGMNSPEAFRRDVELLERQLQTLDGASSRQMEEAVRALGELLGFKASRPDNDFGTGPDVLWEESETKTVLGLELKTDKKNPASYNKKDIGQGHDSLEWIGKEWQGFRQLGLAFVGPEGRCTGEANPSAEMSLITPGNLASLRDEILALIEDLRKILPLERLVRTREECNEAKWSLEAIFGRLNKCRLLDMK
jgi:hypothetical protein